MGIRLGDELLSLTDSYAMLVVDPKTMRVMKEKEFEDDLKGLVCYTGSAHPLRDAKTGDWIDGFSMHQSWLPCQGALFLLGRGVVRDIGLLRRHGNRQARRLWWWKEACMEA